MCAAYIYEDKKWMEQSTNYKTTSNLFQNILLSKTKFSHFFQVVIEKLINPNFDNIYKISPILCKQCVFW